VSGEAQPTVNERIYIYIYIYLQNITTPDQYRINHQLIVWITSKLNVDNSFVNNNICNFILSISIKSKYIEDDLGYIVYRDL